MLSEHVANGLQSQGFHHTTATQKFLRLSDTFFDCLNVTRTMQGIITRKPALHPYRDVDDWRFKVCCNFFLC